MELQRRPVGDMDVLIEMKYCGVCHTDLHFAANHMKSVLKTTYPCVPGHELVGVCSAVGSNVTKVKVGDHIGVGCMVDSCRKCKACKRGEEQMCMKQVATYQGKDFGGGRAATFPPGASPPRNQQAPRESPLRALRVHERHRVRTRRSRRAFPARAPLRRKSSRGVECLVSDKALSSWLHTSAEIKYFFPIAQN